MTLTQEQIEWIVAEVVRRLRAELGEATPSGASLAIEERLVTLATLRGRLNGIRTLRVAATAVVTPAVRDEIRERGIELVRG